MKKLIYFTILLLLPAMAFSQNKVDASEIIAKINRGENISYQDVQITGDLDFTRLQNMQLQRNKNKDWPGNHKSYISTVTPAIKFVNCTFTGHVVAYFSDDKARETYNANFEQEVRFENCVFQQGSAFKYSAFDKAVSFAKSTFKEEALFKYSKFPVSADFSGVRFEETANFKYVTFPRGTTFSGAAFREEANFKYASFSGGVDFSNADFSNHSDFKYTKFSQPLQLKGVSFSGNEDFKYASVDGKSFTSYLLQNR